ncbi:uncharacterized protein LOC128323408 isoform X1 [Hemicordylus capensis]|uniref:uncharacterized protein LOC128323408 isoform X1 n=1 Tax=Hemicordylus capensis TaxID=884348 RepID=UPI002302D3D6|nr:uncharacterized protein LOC128323408 isoform X1 [Hemicordylus capensis]
MTSAPSVGRPKKSELQNSHYNLQYTTRLNAVSQLPVRSASWQQPDPVNIYSEASVPLPFNPKNITDKTLQNPNRGARRMCTQKISPFRPGRWRMIKISWTVCNEEWKMRCRLAWDRKFLCWHPHFSKGSLLGML